MIFSADPRHVAEYQQRTESRLDNIQQIPGMTLCVRCGKRRTTMTGGHNKHGAFVCHACGRDKK